jgi:hypothetical protein
MDIATVTRLTEGERKPRSNRRSLALSKVLETKPCPFRQPAAQVSRTHRSIKTAMILSRQKSKSAYRTRNEVGSLEPKLT